MQINELVPFPDFAYRTRFSSFNAPIMSWNEVGLDPQGFIETESSVLLEMLARLFFTTAPGFPTHIDNLRIILRTFCNVGKKTIHRFYGNFEP